jgi:hypothetical protein
LALALLGGVSLVLDALALLGGVSLVLDALALLSGAALALCGGVQEHHEASRVGCATALRGRARLRSTRQRAR